MEDRLRVTFLIAGFGVCLLGRDACAESPPWMLSFSEQASPWITLQRQQTDELELLRIVLVKQDVQPQQPPTAPALESPAPLPPTANELTASLFASPDTARSLLAPVRKERLRAASDVIHGGESRSRQTTDAGSLLRKSSTAFGVGTQRRNPIVADPRVRGSRVGQLASSGSHWVPARIDLDTMLNKLDSRIIEDIIVVKGPYSALYGPDLRFIDVELMPSPRYEDGWQLGGSTLLNYQTNGEQWYGRQTFQGGEDDWGFRIGYGHKTGSDYHSGDGTDIPSSYKSRDVDVALGYDLTEDSSIEFHYLRLDQTDVEFPGQLFDMNYLVTDGFEATYELRNQDHFDRLVIDSWYNNTRFRGNAQSPAKKTQFPGLYTLIPDYVGLTDVDTTSSGYRALASWDLSQQTRLTAGTDLRFIQQSLDELSSGTLLLPFTDVNSPLPKSRSVNPGLLAELKHDVNERLSFTAGTRVDISQADVVDNPAELASLGIDGVSLADILGTDQFDQNFHLWSAFLTGQYQLNDSWTLMFGAGHSERPPNLTELYVAESFLFLLQNGENTATGDPRLDPERITQVDLGLGLNQGRVRAGANGFYAWINDYITFENMRVIPNPMNGDPGQVNLKYVNTDLATLAGIDSYFEFDATPWATLFANVTYVQGEDRTRNGDFATIIHGGPGSPSTRDPTQPRGFYSGVAGASSESLPSILPLETRLGVRVKPTDRTTAELCARIVDDQDRVAASLLETPTAGFTIWDLRGTWRATDAWLLVAGVENFTNKDFREHLDFRSLSGGFRMRQPGVNFYFGSEVKY